MSRSRLPPPRSSSPIPRLKCIHYLIIFAISFISGFSAFSVAYFAGSTIIRLFVVKVFFGGPPERVYPPAIRDLYELYKSKDYPGKHRSYGIDATLRYKEFDYRQPSTLTYKSAIYDDNIEILYRLPEKTSVSALLLIFHSCRETSQIWFHTPEQQRIIGGALNLGFAALVFNATDKNTTCWSYKANIFENNDIQMVLKGLEGFYKEHPDLANLPRFTFGVSSGGIFSSIFAINRQYPIDGQVLSVSIILPEILYTHVKRNKYPPTIWIRMLRDIEFASQARINSSQQIFIQENIPYNTLIIEPVRVLRTTFRDRIPTLSISASQLIFTKLARNHWINNRNYMGPNPRRRLDWKEFLFPEAPDENTIEMIQDIKKHRNQVTETLNVIFSEHAVSHERSYEALKWLKDTYDTSKTKAHP